jgi:hypothetical protein
MSNGDFEVMPVGTLVEIEAVRKLSNELIALLDNNAGTEAITDKIIELRDFYRWHTDSYREAYQ